MKNISLSHTHTHTIKFVGIIMLFTTIFFSNTSKAQLKVLGNGKVLMGAPIQPNHPADMAANVQVLGTGTPLNCQGRLCIGDMGLNENNVYVGEYGTGDNDQIQVHGKLGQFFTIGSAGTDIRLRIDATTGHIYATSFVYANGVKLLSDERLKTNIKKFTSPFSLLNKLQAVSYNYKLEKPVSIDWSKVDWKNLTEKERKDLEEEKNKVYPEISEEKIGFIAQELQKVFPQLVSTDSKGVMAVDYIGLIPIIIEAMKEQDKKLQELQTQLQSCCAKNDIVNPEKSEQDRKALVQSVSNTFALLEQNNPNPFSQQTLINYTIPDNCNNSSLHVYDLNGNELKSYTINQKGKGNIIIDANSLKAGMYLYTLICDGKEIATKKMILTSK